MFTKIRTTILMSLTFSSVLTGIPSMTLASSGQSSTDGQAEAAAALQRVRDKVDEISRNRSEEQVAKEITAWKQREPKSPEPYIIAANYYLRKTLQPIGINIYSTESGTPPKTSGEQFSVVDPKTGKEVGVLSKGPTGPTPNPRTIRKYRSAAADELERALRLAPDRLDIMLGRALILNDAHDWQPLREQMEVALKRASHDPQNLLWLENKPTPRPATDEVLDSLHSKIVDAFDEKSAQGDRRAKELATLGLKYFPNAVKILSDLATAHAFANDWRTATQYYERAAALAPEDSIVLGNLARSYVKLGNGQKAELAAKRVISLDNDSRAVEQAKEILQLLAEKQPKAR
jgi:tetratricopeptide (TPR) repeat protein